MRFPMSDEVRYEFPLRLHPAYVVALDQYGIPGMPRLADIDEVRFVLDMLSTIVIPDSLSLGRPTRVGDGEDAVDDLYRLCQKIEAQYRAER